MNFNEYQKLAKRTDTSSLKEEKKLFGNLLTYPTLGIAGESGEFADKIKKVFRDKRGKLDDATKQNLMLELGDILWYVAKMARAIGFTLDEVAQANLHKITSRKKRGVLHGDGDHR